MRKEKVKVKNEGKRPLDSDGMSRLWQGTMDNPQRMGHKRKESEGTLRTAVTQCILVTAYLRFRTAYQSHLQGLSLLLALLHP